MKLSLNYKYLINNCYFLFMSSSRNDEWSESMMKEILWRRTASDFQECDTI